MMFNFRIYSLISLMMMVYLFKAVAHEGHDTPGSMPPAPHGGVTQVAEDKEAHKEDTGHGEAEHKHEEGKEEKEEVELYFEAVYKPGKLEIYPLTLTAQNSKTFQEMPMEKISKVEIKAEFPRAKKFQALTPTVSDKRIEAVFDAKSVNRFILHITATFQGEEKLAKIQVEPN